MKKDRRRALKSLVLGGSTVVLAKLPATWSKPVVESVVLPAHAQTSEQPSEETASCSGIDTIRIESPQSENEFDRFIALVDSEDNTIGEDGPTGDLVVTAGSLAAGTYRVFGDSDGPQTHTIIVTTEGCSQETITVTTEAAGCTNLVATVELPSGDITPESGEIPPGEPEHCSAG